jgi:hypothetical protein
MCVQVLKTMMVCVECKQRAAKLTTLRPKPEDFFCEMEASPMCCEGNFMAQVRTLRCCQNDGVTWCACKCRPFGRTGGRAGGRQQKQVCRWGVAR